MNGIMNMAAAICVAALGSYDGPPSLRRHEPPRRDDSPITEAERNRRINAFATKKRANAKRKAAKRQRKSR